MGRFDLSLSLGDDLGIGGRGNAVGLVDGGGFGLLRFGVGCQAAEIEMVYALNDAVKFLFQPVVRADVEVALQQSVKGIVEILPGGVGLACFVGFQSCLEVLFNIG